MNSNLYRLIIIFHVILGKQPVLRDSLYGQELGGMWYAFVNPISLVILSCYYGYRFADTLCPIMCAVPFLYRNLYRNSDACSWSSPLGIVKPISWSITPSSRNAICQFLSQAADIQYKFRIQFVCPAIRLTKLIIRSVMNHCVAEGDSVIFHTLHRILSKVL